MSAMDRRDPTMPEPVVLVAAAFQVPSPALDSLRTGRLLCGSYLRAMRSLSSTQAFRSAVETVVRILPLAMS